MYALFLCVRLCVCCVYVLVSVWIPAGGGQSMVYLPVTAPLLPSDKVSHWMGSSPFLPGWVARELFGLLVSGLQCQGSRHPQPSGAFWCFCWKFELKYSCLRCMHSDILVHLPNPQSSFSRDLHHDLAPLPIGPPLPTLPHWGTKVLTHEFWGTHSNYSRHTDVEFKSLFWSGDAIFKLIGLRMRLEAFWMLIKVLLSERNHSVRTQTSKLWGL